MQNEQRLHDIFFGTLSFTLQAAYKHNTLDYSFLISDVWIQTQIEVFIVFWFH
jgi:hypothetical protein